MTVDHHWIGIADGMWSTLSEAVETCLRLGYGANAEEVADGR